MTSLLPANLLHAPSAQCFMSTYLAAAGQLYGVAEPTPLLVPVPRIIGIHARCQEATRGFRPNRSDANRRIRQAKRALRRGADLPPLHLFQVRDSFYVRDGLALVSAAKARRHPALLAQVTTFRLAQAGLGGILNRAKAEFQHDTGISAIDLSQPQAYAALRSQIEQHQTFLETGGGHLWAREEAIANWLQTVYGPIATGIADEGLVEDLPGQSVGDIYWFLTIFGAQAAARSGLSLSAALLDLINVTHQSWRQKAHGLLPPCFFRGSCPFQ